MYPKFIHKKEIKSIDHWQCPYCGQNASITENSKCIKNGELATIDKGINGDLIYNIVYITCPNSKCKENTIDIVLFKRSDSQPANKHAQEKYNFFSAHRLRPKGKAKPMPDYIPEHIRQDYFEACLILDDSPKASATLSRRCLQGIIRDHFKIVKNTLLLEINALKNELSPNLWLAVDSIRKVGNVGAHFEKDVNLIVDISRDSANALIRLIELLFEETYIKDHDQEKRIAEALQAGKNVDQQKNIDIDK